MNGAIVRDTPKTPDATDSRVISPAELERVIVRTNISTGLRRPTSEIQ
jgi:hypothetical protein